MIFLALDIATQTGWSILNENKELIEFGTIQINPSMTLPQRIIFFSNAIAKILEKFKPDHVFIEDLICGISGVKTLSYLGRLNGAAILTCTKQVNNNIYFFNPPKWKTNSFSGLCGMAKKWEIQLAVVDHYKMKFNITDEEIQSLLISKRAIDENIKERNKDIKKLNISLKDIMKRVNSRRNPIPLEEKIVLSEEVKRIKNEILNIRKNIKLDEKKIDKDMNKVSLQITSRTGITTDISDSIGINFCGIKEYFKSVSSEVKENK